MFKLHLSHEVKTCLSDLWHQSKHVTEHMPTTNFTSKEVDCLLPNIPAEQIFLEITTWIISP